MYFKIKIIEKNIEIEFSFRSTLSTHPIYLVIDRNEYGIENGIIEINPFC